MINNAIVTSSTITVPTLVFTASGQRAVTTMVLVNQGIPDPLGNESINSCNVNIYIVKLDGGSVGLQSLIVSSLPVPAGETVFLSEERMVLDDGDQIWVGASALSNGNTTYGYSTTPAGPGNPLIVVTVSSLQV